MALLTMIGATVLALGATQDSGGVLAIRAKHIDLGDGQRIADGVLVVENGKVRAVGAGASIPEGAVEFEHDGVVTPGLIACHEHAGTQGEGHDSTRSVMDTARIAYAFEPSDEDFEALARSGITSIVLAPDARSLAPGQTAVVKTAGGTVVSDAAHLVLGFSTSALSSNRAPTSWAGALAELEQRFSDPKGGFADAAAGRIGVLFQTGRRADVLRAIGFARQHDLKGALRGTALSGELAEDVAASGLGHVIGPFGVGASQRSLDGAVRLAAAGVPLAFGVSSPYQHPDVLRWSAAMCVRNGMDSGIAMRALTSSAANIAGVADRVGKLEAGLDADFVLWSGDPLDLTSTVEAVYVDGVRVHGGDE